MGVSRSGTIGIMRGVCENIHARIFLIIPLSNALILMDLITLPILVGSIITDWNYGMADREGAVITAPSDHLLAQTLRSSSFSGSRKCGSSGGLISLPRCCHNLRARLKGSLLTPWRAKYSHTRVTSLVKMR